MSTDPNAPRPARAPASHTVAGRIRASMLVKIVSPVIGALVIGSVATALFAGWLSGRPSPSEISATDLLILGLLLVAAAVALSWVTIRMVTRPLRMLSGTARQVAAGNLDAHFVHTSHDEIGQLASALETMKMEVRSQLELIGSQADALQEASLRITSARDEERRRLARDLHDGLQQQLVVLQIGLGMAAERVSRDPAVGKAIFAELGAEVERVLDRVREVSHDLYPSVLRDLGLTSALRSQAGRIPITTRITTDPDPLPRLARDIESSAYFILSEAIANVLKHAEASEIAIALTIEEQRLTITVSDNGIGFQRDADADRHGLTSMDDRIRSLGGDLFITSGAAGTVIRASLPLDPGRAPLPSRQGGEALPAIEQVLAETAGAGVFVGREREIGTLRDLFQEAAAGRGRLVLLSGDAGIGKTRTANELATYASSRGAEVLVGRCYEGGGAPAYWPWIQVLRAYIRGRDLTDLSTLMGPGAADISQIVPELSGRLPEAAEPAVNDPRQARFRLFDSITSLLRNAAAARPLVIVLDDLQSADTPSLLLLEFLAGSLGGCRLLIVGTHRLGLSPGHPLEKTLVGLRGEAATTIVLPGLREDEVARFMEVATGARPAEPVLSAVYRQTEGNPLFVREVVRLLAAEGRLEGEANAAAWDLDIPETVRETIGRRMDHLSPGCNDVLAVASAIGREFDLRVLQRVSGILAHRVSAALDEAVAARVLVELPGAAAPGSYRFNHTLLRETIYGSLAPRRRHRLHRRIAEVLEAMYGDGLDSHLAELAHHYEAAGRRRGGMRAIDYAARAGERAASLLAFEEASRHYERALRSLGEGRKADRGIKVPEPRRCDLLLALGETQWRAGDTPRARETFTQAASIARRLHDPNRLAAAAVGYGEGLGAYEFAEGADDVLVGLLEEALAALDSWRRRPVRRRYRRAGDSPRGTTARLRVKVLARLAVELYYTDQVERRAALGQEAVELAQTLGDPAAQLIALYGRFRSVLGPDALDERLAAAEEIVRLGEEIGDRETASRGRHLRLVTLLERGDRAAVDEGIETWARHAEELRQPLFRWQVLSFKTMVALLEGRFADGEGFMKEALKTSGHGPGQAAQIRFGAQRFLHHWGRGRLEEMEAQAREMADRYPWLPGWRTGLAVIYAELDRPVEARAYFEDLAAADFADMPRDGNWLGSIAMASLACAYLRDFRRAALLYDLLEPYEQRCIVVHAGGFSLGSAATFLGILAGTLGRFEEAARLFETAMAANEALGARPMTVMTLIQHAAMLTSRNGPGDASTVIGLLERALDMAQEMDMRRAATVIDDLQRRAESLRRVAGSAAG
jgi:signal transduction histidine kinase/tetratricopeptide (TPR) repeat protein